MKILIIYCHPNPKSFNHAIKDLVVKNLAAAGHKVKLRDLYDLQFDPVLSAEDLKVIHEGNIPDLIKIEQECIVWADRLILIHPVWWTGFPAMVKGYIDRVFSFGFAYTIEGGMPKGLLNGKKVLIINTTGAPSEYYQQIGMAEALKKTSDKGIYEFCGLEVIDHLFFGAVPTVDDAARKGYLQEISQKVAEYFG
jgi:NAD(P)H dehydrogenase (quinone)